MRQNLWGNLSRLEVSRGVELVYRVIVACDDSEQVVIKKQVSSPFASHFDFLFLSLHFSNDFLNSRRRRTPLDQILHKDLAT